MKNHKYLDRTLITLKRAYSKDETIEALCKKLSEVEIELGKALSYIDELKHEALNKKHNRELIKENKDLKKTNEQLICKIVKL